MAVIEKEHLTIIYSPGLEGDWTRTEYRGPYTKRDPLSGPSEVFQSVYWDTLQEHGTILISDGVQSIIVESAGNTMDKLTRGVKKVNNQPETGKENTMDQSARGGKKVNKEVKSEKENTMDKLERGGKKGKTERGILWTN